MKQRQSTSLIMSSANTCEAKKSGESRADYADFCVRYNTCSISVVPDWQFKKIYLKAREDAQGNQKRMGKEIDKRMEAQKIRLYEEWITVRKGWESRSEREDKLFFKEITEPNLSVSRLVSVISGYYESRNPADISETERQTTGAAREGHATDATWEKQVNTMESSAARTALLMQRFSARVYRPPGGTAQKRKAVSPDGTGRDGSPPVKKGRARREPVI